MGDAGFALWAAPLAYGVAALAAASVRDRAREWWTAELGASVAATAALGGVALSAWKQEADALGGAMLLLIAVLGWVIVRYSRRYLEGEPQQQRYVVSLLATLASVAAVAVTDNLGVLAIAWIASSLWLHRLLTFYEERPAAVIVAHKKFLASRFAELCLLLGLGLMYAEAGTLSMSGVEAHVRATPELSIALHAAAVLIALAVILKSAQLPVHGWLIQVMEAPTPVSALLHAGLINLGGFVLLRLASLLAEAPAAQWLLVVVGGLTAALAGLVMMTRISIKVRLAWSTCAQMGFMLMECGLGLYDLALLHLLAHSLYKAYAFLSAGEIVREVRRAQLWKPELATNATATIALRAAAAPLAMLIAAGSMLVWQQWTASAALPFAGILLLGLGFAPLLWRERAPIRGVLQLIALVQLYLIWHIGAVAIAPAAPPITWAMTAWVGVLFGALYAVQLWVLARPGGAFAQRLFPWAYAGFYLDERFTRLTFRLWPARLPTAARLRTLPTTKLLGEQA